MLAYLMALIGYTPTSEAHALFDAYDKKIIILVDNRDKLETNLAKWTQSAKETNDAWRNEQAAHAATKELLRVCELERDGLRDQSAELTEVGFQHVESIAAWNRAYDELDEKYRNVVKHPQITNVFVKPFVGPDGGKISRYALMFEVIANNKLKKITARSLAASNKAKKELEDDATTIRTELSVV